MTKKQSDQGRELLLIFTRNPESGKVKKRLAAGIGDEAALKVYKHLLRHTAEITINLQVEKWVFYSEEIPEDDIWEKETFNKKVQQGKDLGERMKNAFHSGFKSGYEKVVIIGSDLFDIQQEDLKKAFLILDDHDYVIGPAKDGGYYLLGMTKYTPELFIDKEWSTERVLRQTLDELEQERLKLLPVRNDIDTFEDLRYHPELIGLINYKG